MQIFTPRRQRTHGRSDRSAHRNQIFKLGQGGACGRRARKKRGLEGRRPRFGKDTENEIDRALEMEAKACSMRTRFWAAETTCCCVGVPEFSSGAGRRGRREADGAPSFLRRRSMRGPVATGAPPSPYIHIQVGFRGSPVHTQDTKHVQEVNMQNTVTL